MQNQDTTYPTFAGVFEAHVTVELPVDEHQFRHDCAQLGVKPIIIELPSGTTPVQPMTSSVFHGTFASAIASSQELVSSLRSRGYSPTRLKLEAGPENRDLPKTDADALRMPKEYYFEHHLKMLVRDKQEYRTLQEVCAPYDAHVSSNAIKHSPDGFREVFVTVRSYAAGRITAEATIGALTEALRMAGVPLLKRICEYCVYDSNIEVDHGWQ